MTVPSSEGEVSQGNTLFSGKLTGSAIFISMELMWIFEPLTGDHSKRSFPVRFSQAVLIAGSRDPRDDAYDTECPKRRYLLLIQPLRPSSSIFLNIRRKGIFAPVSEATLSCVSPRPTSSEEGVVEVNVP